MNDCLFCKIIAGTIPSKKVYEDEFVFAFHDIAPNAPVHVLVVPKTHIASANDVTEENSILVAKVFEVIPKIAKSLGLGAVALTDHETLSGLPEFMEEAAACEIEAIPGVEIFARLDSAGDTVFHLTGLDFDPSHPAIVAFTDMLVQKRTENTRAIFELAVEKGIYRGITWEDVIAHNRYTDWFFCTQVYYALDAMGIIPLNKRYETNDLAFHSPEAHAIELYIPPMKDVIRAIRDAGGVAVLAHPKEPAFPFVREMVDLGLNGIEISHPSISENASKLAIHASLEYNLYCSGGTDHTGPMSSFGGANARPVCNGISKTEFEILKERRLG